MFKKKIDCDNKVTYRARLEARGFTQRYGVDFEETFFPVVRHSTLKLLFALSVKFNFKIWHLDVTTAFLNGKLPETVYMRIPEGFQNTSHTNKVSKFQKATYGLKQSSRVWYKKVEIVLNQLNFRKSQ